MQTTNRRQFLDRSVHASLALAAGGSLAAATKSARAADASKTAKTASAPKIAAFTKSFQDRPVPEVCRIFKRIGLDGLDLTVRPGGHIDPKNVTRELPQAVRAAQKAGVEISFLTTSITKPDADAERILAAAAEAGINRIKLGYYRYREFGTLKTQMAAAGKQIGKVAKLAARFKVLPCIHIHSGAFIPSHGTMLYELIRDFRPDELGAYVDTLHMAKEGGGEGWRQGLDLLGDWLALCSIKNCVWEKTRRDRHGQQRWRTINVPVADGICPLPEFVAALKKLNFTGMYSLHSEYKGGHSFQQLDTDGCIRQTALDFKFFKPLV